ncbi:uncharacterized protein A4U43_C10F14840 [Asparagus officinalis]|uniref:Retrotransposon Copia-like N-terminal domain-containing protein n=1 Tax=Asparagus officinalis TaxID=4686 RepID=A0A5P1E4N0_ASPOF|nr:uncharacterized protein A4U43_C10F14840 [Asparagus officinalis]
MSSFTYRFTWKAPCDRKRFRNCEIVVLEADLKKSISDTILTSSPSTSSSSAIPDELIMVVTKSIVVDVNRREKLNEQNYDVWHCKIQYLLEKQDMLETITQLVIESEPGNTTQHKRDHEAFQAWKRKDHVAHILMLSSMRDDIMLCFERYRSAMAV